jgi:ketosteroid isomerase-like protein
VVFNNGDVDGLMKLHWNSPELLSYPPDELQLKGYDAVKNSYTKGFSENKGARLEYTSTYNIPYTDGVAGFGTYRWVMPIEGGSPIIVEGRYTDVKAYKDGKMVIIHDHSSVLMPPPPAEETKVDTVGQ